jgi:fatty acid desaturase
MIEAKHITVKPTFIRGRELKTLTKLSPWKSIFAISLNWLFIFAAIAIHIKYAHPLVYFLSWMLIATRLYAFYSLIHDAIHFLIVRNKKWNDLIAQVFLGLPIFISLKNMRAAHLAHHKHLQTDLDPEMKHLNYDEFQFPKSKQGLIRLFLMDISGINFVYYQLLKAKSLLINFNPSGYNKARVMLFSFYFLIFTLAILAGFGKEIFLYWLLPYATLYQVLNRLRLATEHFNIDENFGVNTRSVIPSFIEKWTLTPHNLGYHLDHHLYPGVPFYNLPQLHQMLMTFEAYSNEVLVEKSYFQVIKKCIR